MGPGVLLPLLRESAAWLGRQEGATLWSYTECNSTATQRVVGWWGYLVAPHSRVRSRDMLPKSKEWEEVRLRKGPERDGMAGEAKNSREECEQSHEWFWTGKWVVVHKNYYGSSMHNGCWRVRWRQVVVQVSKDESELWVSLTPCQRRYLKTSREVNSSGPDHLWGWRVRKMTERLRFVAKVMQTQWCHQLTQALQEEEWI